MTQLRACSGRTWFWPATTDTLGENGGDDVMGETALSAINEATAVAEINALLPAANAGDEHALADLRSVLNAHPELWAEVGNLAREAELTLVRAAAGTNTVQKEAILRKLSSLRRELSGPRMTPLEGLLIDRVVVGWLGLAVAEGIYHQALGQGLEPSDDEFHQRRVERAQRRYLAAVKALATVRRLGMPSMQVNIGDKQVNVAG